ncbi:MAG: 1-deoxy-D-xylulose-5-phosphate reductoisomerase [Alistipes sp.]|nr:1-deoxy-D-xylulose-5-phosphate reductoisomerase [Alistipes sp.]
MKQRIAILGSTGSIGRQTLEVIRANQDLFEVETITANNNWELLVNQAIEHKPDSVVIANENFYPQVKQALENFPIKVYAGRQSLCQVVAASNVDTVVSALVGYSGLQPTLSAIRAGKKIALANKETLVVAGEIVIAEAIKHNAPIVPVDSEHSAIFQCLSGECSPVEKVILTASGGPFLHTPLKQLKEVTVEQALKHPNWSMGAKITIDSATMMNKGFEVIEARWLFGLRRDQIEVVVHPQSVIHSMVQFCDGAIKAQLGTPDMRIPIQYALTFPERKAINTTRYDFISSGGVFNFMAADTEKFRNLALAYEALEKGGNLPCVLNAANEVAVHSFLERKIGFLDMSNLIEECMSQVEFIAQPSLEEYEHTDILSRKLAQKLIETKFIR